MSRPMSRPMSSDADRRRLRRLNHTPSPGTRLIQRWLRNLRAALRGPRA